VTRIAILDYGMGNLRSVEKALEHVGVDAELTHDHERARGADGVILPGVGAFPKAMERIRERGLDELIAERVSSGVPVLGICLGLQLIFESSDERDGATGLGLVDGPVSGLQADGLKVPHIGWSPVAWAKESRLTAGLAQAEPFYFVHSFAPRPANPDDVLGTAEYGERFVCAVERGNVFGAQFHPEKSSGGGLRLLRNFAGICASVPA
jgi:imidazole glycerol-phosphate synthase subunit HisH